MAEVRKISVSMPAEVIERVKGAAEALGQSVSSWLTSAAREALDEQSRWEIARLDAELMVREYEEEFGPIPPEVHADVDAFFAELEEDELRRAEPAEEARRDDLRDAG